VAELRIHGVAHGGEGVGRAVAGDDTRTWLVEGALPGERVRAEATDERARMIRGRVLEVLEPGPARAEPPCPLAGRCGGCGWQHVRPAAQAGLKAEVVAGLLRRVAHPPIAVVASPQALGYRRRARMHFERRGDELALGFLGRGGRAVVDAPDCPVLAPPLRHALARVRALAHMLPAFGELHLLTDGARVIAAISAKAEVGGQRVAMPPLLGDADAVRARLERALDAVLVGLSAPGPGGVVAVGEEALELDADGPEDMSVRTGAAGFAQAQAPQNAALVAHVLAAAGGPPWRRGLELFAGAGNFTRGLAPRCRALTAVELDGGGAAGLQQLAGRLAVRGAQVEVRREAAAGTLRRAAAAGAGFDLVVLDPPRGGLGKAAAADLARVARRRTVYVSCDPATLVRDLEVLTAAGHRVGSVTVFDMMPMTPEVEVVVVLDRAGP
jgi:23S rRNA (uracil1939-C5)-methyltransferase